MVVMRQEAVNVAEALNMNVVHCDVSKCISCSAFSILLS